MGKKKAGKKKAGKKKAAKKSVAKKKAAKKTAVVTKKGKKKKATAVDVEVMTPAETAVAEVREELAIADFKDPMSMGVVKLEKEAQKLYKARVGDEFKLSFTLYALKEKNAAADRGYEEKDYFTRFLGISHTKANAMIANARFLIEMGVTNLKNLVGLSWPKVKMLKAPVDKGAITKRGIGTWLKKCTAGPDGVAEWDLEKQIKDLLASKAKTDVDDSLVNFSFKAPAYCREVVNRFEEIAEKAFGGDRGNWYIQALSEVAAAHINQVDAELLQAKGLAGVKEMAEKIAPVACVFIPVTDDVTENTKLGIVSRIYQGYSPDSEGLKELRYCLAGTEAEAKKFMKVKEVRPFPIEVAKSIMPDEVVSTGSIESSEALDEDLSEDDLKEAIKNLVVSKKISKGEYKKRKAALMKKHAKGIELNRAIYKWLKSK